MKRKLFRWINIILITYGLIGIAIYYLQDKLLFHPIAVDKKFNYNFPEPYKEINLPFDSASNINIVKFTTQQAPKGVVLYFHGNMENIAHYNACVTNFTKNGYEIWMMDYPGYGKSTGPMNEQRLYEYAEQFYKLGRACFAKDSIILYGKSMGSGIAAYIASRHDCKALLLETPYYSVTSVAAHYFPVYPVDNMIQYKIPTYKYLQKVIAPITIFHGTSDHLIPYSNACRLKPFLKPTDNFITIDGGGHNDLDHFQLFHQQLNNLLK